MFSFHSHTDPAETKKVILKGLADFLTNDSDDSSKESIHNFIYFLNSLLRVKSMIPPTSEIMAIIKSERPKLYHAARLQLPSTHHLSILFQVNMDPTLAKDRLEQFRNNK
ncbi:hypothetical protein ACQCN2_09165 [Brevibacillus ginsengisoli]|uniref:hypothetical protein n=1 Tax=Brevibacillus ginsengisoli TaxID=363854 RepID=UPI003CE9E170